MVRHGAYDEHRARQDADQPLGNGTEERAADTIVGMRPDNDDANFKRAGHAGDLRGRRAGGPVDYDVRRGGFAVLLEVALYRGGHARAQPINVRSEAIKDSL